MAISTDFRLWSSFAEPVKVVVFAPGVRVNGAVVVGGTFTAGELMDTVGACPLLLTMKKR